MLDFLLTTYESVLEGGSINGILLKVPDCQDKGAVHQFKNCLCSRLRQLAKNPVVGTLGKQAKKLCVRREAISWVVMATRLFLSDFDEMMARFRID